MRGMMRYRGLSKAKLNVRGNEMMEELSKKLDFRSAGTVPGTML